MVYRVKVDLWLRDNLRRGDVVDLPEDEGRRLVEAGILEDPEGVSAPLETSPGPEVPENNSEAAGDPEEATEEALPRPNKSANVSEWVAYAESLGHKVKGLSKAELIALTTS